VAPDAPPPKKFNIRVFDEGAGTFLPRLAKAAGVKVTCVGDLFEPVEHAFTDTTFDEVLAWLARTSGIESQKQPDGSYRVGYPSDLLLEANDPKDVTPVEYLYRTRHLDGESLAGALSAAFPDLKVMVGPLHLSPALDDGTPVPGMGGMPGAMMTPMMTGSLGSGAGLGSGLSGGDIGSIKALQATATPFKRHAVSLIGPVNEVRRALILARRMDRGRRSVRINVSMSEMTSTDASNLGVNWDFTGTNLNFAELPNPALGNVVAPTGTTPGVGGNPGLRFGTFAHTPASVNLSLQAGIQKGTVKTLADPSLLVLDGERCFLLLGNKILFPRQTGVTALGNPSYDVGQLATGIYLQLAVQIGLDDDVVITVYPQNSYVSGSQTFSGNAYPIVTTREAQTTVLLRSGQMMAIGGLRQNNATDNASQVPFLSSIPFLGSLFGVKNKNKNRDELVIIIQPELLPFERGRKATIEEVK